MIKRLSFLMLAIFLCAGNCEQVFAISAANEKSLYGDSDYYWPGQVATAGACTVTITPATPSTAPGAAPTGSNTDYAGRQILSAAQLSTIQQNQNTYQTAGTQVGVPWQMLAALHYRETGLKLYNPGNGQGAYQITSAGYAPASSIDQATFLSETIDAANFLKHINPKLSATSDANTIKDIFYSYNGRAYDQQAAQNGFNATTQGFEGSPYVMNQADAKRDPSALGKGETTWGQIKVDHGGIEYPADSGYGAYVIYADLAGLPIGGGSCSTAVNCSGATDNATVGLSPVRQNIVCTAKAELAKWTSGQLTPAQGFLTYSQGVYEEWCADFVSWVYDQAKVPLKPDPTWRISYVPNIQAVPSSNPSFHYHAAAGYTPRPGDLGIISDTGSHVIVIVGVSGSTITSIGGDEAVSVPHTYGTKNPPSTSKLQQDTNYAGVTGYVSPD